MPSYSCLLSNCYFRAGAGAGIGAAMAEQAFNTFLSSKTPKYPYHRLLRRLNYSIISCVAAEEKDVKSEKLGFRSNNLVSLEYADLKLSPESSKELGPLRVRQHVNPLSSYLCIPAPVPDWNQVFRDPKLPLMVDVGSGSGRFLMWLAKNNPDSGNYLGMEIREKLVKRAEVWVKELALSNIHFIFANATVSFERLVSSYPGPLTLVSILCPDPHFKKRNHKRRVVQKPLVDSIIKSLMPRGKVFIQSDVLEVALDMRNQFDAELDRLEHVDAGVGASIVCDNEGWLLSNPMGIRTEREIHAELEGAKVYRRLYQKKL